MKVVVLAGGISTERDVSLTSGSMIYKALKKKGHEAILLDVFLGLPEADLESVFSADIDWAKDISGITSIDPDVEKIKALRPDWKKNFFGPNVLSICQAADVVFLALHGANGEDGKIQACFDLMGIRYTGTDYVSSAIAMDKGIAKDIFKANGVPTPKGILLKRGEVESERVPFPCIVKGTCGGSSVGVSIAHNEMEYEKAKAEAFRYDEEVVIEQYIKGREFSIGVMNGKALPIIEIAPISGFYDYKNKYQAGSTVETCPAMLSEELTKQMQSAAEAGFKALRLRNYARLDFMMDEKEDFYCLEANTLPGMTPTSLLPQEAKAAGIEFEDLCEMIMKTALED